MVYLQLFIEFFKIGLFSVGGGMATLPFLVDLTTKYDWYTKAELSNMVAQSEYSGTDRGEHGDLCGL